MKAIRRAGKKAGPLSRWQSAVRVVPNLRVLLMLVLPLGIMSVVTGFMMPSALLAATADRDLSQAPQADYSVAYLPDLAPPTNLQITTLDSSFHVTWVPSTDPDTAWHVVSVWDGATLQQSKVVGRTGKAIQTNGLLQNHTYTVKVQAMNASGGLSAPISANPTTDTQSPMRNAAFFENFNGGQHGDLDYNYFDVRSSHGSGLRPESLDLDRIMLFNNERHFHTQLVSGKQRAELYLRPRVPFDFAGRTGTFQFEVDMSPVQHSQGKWFEVHLAKNLPWSAEEFGAGRGDDFIDSIEFSMRAVSGPVSENTVNIPMITVNIGGTVYTYEGTARQMTPINIRVPVVLKVSETSAEFFVNGQSVLRATGFTLPFNRGYWIPTHRGWYAPRDEVTAPVIVQQIHWETMQFDGPDGNYNPVVRTYLQPGCQGVVHNDQTGVLGCSEIEFSPSQRTQTVQLNIPENTALARSAKLLYNGWADGGILNVSVNGNSMNVPTKQDGYFYTLNAQDFPANWLQTGNNTLTFTLPGSGSAEITQVEVETIYNQQRVMTEVPVEGLPMLSVSNQNFRVDHMNADPDIYTATTYLYSLGPAEAFNWTAQVVTSETPWMTVSPASGTIRPAAVGGGMTPLTFRIDFNGVTTDADGEVGVIKILGGNMPVYIGVLIVADGEEQRPNFITSFNNLTTTFNKDAIPDYHGTGGATPTVTSTVAPTATPLPDLCNLTFSDVPRDHWAWNYVTYMACNGIVSGYADGTFRPNNDVSRGQIAKIVSNTAGFTEEPGAQIYQDVAQSNSFYTWINRLSRRGYMGGYNCGGPGEPCDSGNRPYFRPYASASRGQIAKIVSNTAEFNDTPTTQTFEDVPATNTFYLWIERLAGRAIMGGYQCSSLPQAPCVPPMNRPYFLWGSNATRAQTAKITYNALIGTGR